MVEVEVCSEEQVQDEAADDHDHDDVSLMTITTNTNNTDGPVDSVVYFGEIVFPWCVKLR